jgi:hypothetical protein
LYDCPSSILKHQRKGPACPNSPTSLSTSKLSKPA